MVDVGVAADVAPDPAILDRKIRRGTRDLAVEPAMSVDESVRALDTGAQVATASYEDPEAMAVRIANDTVYGLGTDAFSPGAIAQLLAASAAVEVERREVPQPGEGGPHQNCVAKRRSLSRNAKPPAA